MDVEINKEADASELREVIYAFGQEDTETVLTPRTIKKCLDILPKSIGYALRNSAPLEDDSYRLEMDNGMIIHAIPREGRSGVAFGHPYNIEEHFEIHLKFHAKALDAIGEQLHGWEVKNG